MASVTRWPALFLLGFGLPLSGEFTGTAGGNGTMSELIESLEKSILFLKNRYPAGHTLLSCLEAQLESLHGRDDQRPETLPCNETPAD
jgi:hypothetical protein